MKIDLGNEIVFEVSYNGKVYTLKEPSVMEVKDFQDKVKKSNDDGITEIIAFLEKLGMPSEVSNSLGMIKLSTLLNELIGALTGKK